MKPWHWVSQSGETSPGYPPLAGEEEADLVIVGAGFTGLAAAIRAAELGARVLLLERDIVGAGASGRTGGMVVPQYPSTLSPRDARAALGEVHGERLSETVAGSAAALFDFIRTHRIRCDAVQNGWLAPAHDAGRLQTLRDICSQWRALGAKPEFLERDAMAVATGARGFLGGWRAPSGGHVNPYALCVGLARVATSKGVRIHEHSPALAVRREGQRWLVGAKGGCVRTEQVLLAMNGLAGNVWPGLARTVIPLRLFLMMTEPVGHNLRASIMPDNQCFTDVGKVSYFSRYDRDGRLMAGGAMFGWPPDPVRPALAHVRDMVGHMFPQLGEVRVSPDTYWEGVDGVNENRLPSLQRLARGVYALGGYSTRGVALANALGPLVAEMICGRRDAADLPLPLQGLSRIPAHAAKKLAARLVFPLYKRDDRRAASLTR